MQTKGRRSYHPPLTRMDTLNLSSNKSVCIILLNILASACLPPPPFLLKSNTARHRAWVALTEHQTQGHTFHLYGIYTTTTLGTL